MTKNRHEKASARDIASELDVPYNLALSLLRTVREADPGLRGGPLRNRCAELLERSRKS